MCDISIIMGVYNNEDTIERAIQSILNQSFSNFEFIICDDCSIDNSYELLQKIAKTDNRIVLLKNPENLGLSATLNKCINVAKGKYVARMDGDDISHKNRLFIQKDFLDNNLEFSIVGSSRRTFDNNGVWNVYGVSGELLPGDLIKGNMFTHPTVMMRKHDLISAKLYTVSKRTLRGQDLDLWCKMYSKGFRGYVLQNVLLDYYEDRYKIKEVKVKYRINNFLTKMIWRRKLSLPIRYDIYAYKELLAVIVPNALLGRIKRAKKNGRDRY